MGNNVDRVDGVDWFGVDLARGKERTVRAVILCSDEFCIKMATRKVKPYGEFSKPRYVCDEHYEELSRAAAEKRGSGFEWSFLPEQGEGTPPLILNEDNKEPASGHSRGNCSGCGCNQ